jgi:hypothetical protein
MTSRNGTGANVKAVQKMLGHASAAMTLDIYADLFNDDLEAVATVLDQARGQNVGTGWQPAASGSVNGPLNGASQSDNTPVDQQVRSSSPRLRC